MTTRTNRDVAREWFKAMCLPHVESDERNLAALLDEQEKRVRLDEANHCRSEFDEHFYGDYRSSGDTVYSNDPIGFLECLDRRIRSRRPEAMSAKKRKRSERQPKEFRDCTCYRHYYAKLPGKRYTYHTDGTPPTVLTVPRAKRTSKC